MARNITSNLGRYSDLYVVLAIVTIIIMMVLPLPAFLLDVLLAANISLSLLILLITMSIREPLEVAAFPSLLLIITLFRLSLNVPPQLGSSCLRATGRIIQAFGNFVVGGNYVVGFVIFSS